MELVPYNYQNQISRGGLGQNVISKQPWQKKVQNCLSRNDRNTSEKCTVRQSHCSANTEEYSDRYHGGYDTRGQCHGTIAVGTGHRLKCHHDAHASQATQDGR